MIPTRKITTRGTSVMVHAELGAALCVAKFRLPRLFFLSLMIFLALGACDLLFEDTFSPPEWIQGNWAGAMAISFSDDRFAIRYANSWDFHTYHTMQDGSYDRSSSKQYVVHLVDVDYVIYDGTWFHKDKKVSDWTFTKLSTTQMEVTGTDSGVLTKF